MKNLRIDGKKYFSPKEYLRLSQIKSLFSRYSKHKREGKLKPPTEKFFSDNCLQNEIVNEEVNSNLMAQEQFKRCSLNSFIRKL